MRFSVWPSPQQSWTSVLEVARHAEATGWDGVWFADHFLPNTPEATGPVLECWATVAALAATVPRVRLGTLVCGNTYRHPAVLANIAAGVDVISGGRLVLGLGAGWQENEHRAYGIPFFTVGQRLEMLEEACRVVKGLTTADRTDLAGSHYTLTDAPMEPKPVSDPLPLLIGGGGEKVTMRIAAEHADEWNCWGTPETLAHKVGVLERHCDDLGRDPATIARSAQTLLFLSEDEASLEPMRAREMPMAATIGRPEQVVEVLGAYAKAGVDEVIVPDFTLGTGTERTEKLDLFLERVAAPFRTP